MQCSTLLCHTYVVCDYVKYFNQREFSIRCIFIKWIFLHKGDIQITMFYVFSKSEEKAGFDPSAIICVCVFGLMIFPILSKMSPLYDPHQIIIIINTEIKTAIQNKDYIRYGRYIRYYKRYIQQKINKKTIAKNCEI